MRCIRQGLKPRCAALPLIAGIADGDEQPAASLVNKAGAGGTDFVRGVRELHLSILLADTGILGMAGQGPDFIAPEAAHRGLLLSGFPGAAGDQFGHVPVQARARLLATGAQEGMDEAREFLRRSDVRQGLELRGEGSPAFFRTSALGLVTLDRQRLADPGQRPGCLKIQAKGNQPGSDRRAATGRQATRPVFSHCPAAEPFGTSSR